MYTEEEMLGTLIGDNTTSNEIVSKIHYYIHKAMGVPSEQVIIKELFGDIAFVEFYPMIDPNPYYDFDSQSIFAGILGIIGIVAAVTLDPVMPVILKDGLPNTYYSRYKHLALYLQKWHKTGQGSPQYGTRAILLMEEMIRIVEDWGGLTNEDFDYYVFRLREVVSQPLKYVVSDEKKRTLSPIIITSISVLVTLLLLWLT